MIDEDQFKALLASNESEVLDFKASNYNLGDVRGKASLVKDVVAMANTPRE